MYSTSFADIQSAFICIVLGVSKELSSDMEGFEYVSLMGEGFFGEVGGVGVLFLGGDFGGDCR